MKIKSTRKIITPLSSSLVLIVLLLMGFIFICSQIEHRSILEQKKNLEVAVQRDIVHCYAIEGKYPESIDYLIDHYGLTFNQELFTIDYIPIGSNIMPDYTVLYIGD